jgi:hypothetical protein
MALCQLGACAGGCRWRRVISQGRQQTLLLRFGRAAACRRRRRRGARRPANLSTWRAHWAGRATRAAKSPDAAGFMRLRGALPCYIGNTRRCGCSGRCGRGRTWEKGFTQGGDGAARAENSSAAQRRARLRHRAASSAQVVLQSSRLEDPLGQELDLLREQPPPAGRFPRVQQQQ